MNFQDASKYGFNFSVDGAVQPRGWIDADSIASLAADAELVSTANTTVPVEMTAYYDPKVIEIMTRPLKAREIFNEVKKGDWTAPYAKFRVTELTGGTQPYSDYANAGKAATNDNWMNREQYLFQTNIEYGDFEVAVSASAKIQMVAEKQRAAATALDIDANKFYLLGVEGKDIFGLLNAPNLPAAITPLPSGTGASVLWADKNTQQIYDDILSLHEQLVNQCSGWVDNSTRQTLVVSPAAAVALGKASNFNVSVLDMLNKYLTNLKIVTLPEVGGASGAEVAMLIANDVQGNATGELGFSEKVRAGRIIPKESSFSQKWTSTTYGCIVYYPFAIATMRGHR